MNGRKRVKSGQEHCVAEFDAYSISSVFLEHISTPLIENCPGNSVQFLNSGNRVSGRDFMGYLARLAESQ